MAEMENMLTDPQLGAPRGVAPADIATANFKVVRRYLNLASLNSRLTVEPGATPAGFDGWVSTSGFTHASVFGRSISGVAWTSAGIAAIKGGIAPEAPQLLASPAEIDGDLPLLRDLDVTGDSFIDLITTTAETGVQLAIDIYLYGRKTS